MSVLEKLGGSVKTLMDGMKSMTFSPYGGYGYGASYVPPVSLYGNSMLGGLPGTTYDYRTAAGVLWQNPSAAACFVALTKAFAQAHPILEKRVGKEWEQVEEHPLIDLLNVPNEFYSGERLFGVTLISTLANGSGYWLIERDRKGDPGELWFVPPVGLGDTGIAPVWDEKSFIKEYRYITPGKADGEPVAREDVVFFRHGLNPANTREPWAPLRLGSREIATLNSASTYTGALLRNSAVPSGMIGLEGSSLASGTPPTPQQAEEMERKVNSKFRGDGAGKVFVSSLPWKFTPFNWSPAQMSIDKIQQWPQGIVCALLGTPEIVALLPTGEQPTYQNLAASMEWWWNNTVIPLEDAFGSEIETQLFPSFGLDRHDYRLSWDRSNVPALQEDEEARHTMIREDYKAGVIDLKTATEALGHEATPDMEGKFHPSAVGKNPAEGGDVEPLDPDEIERHKRLNEAAKSFEDAIKKFDPNQPRDDDGKWTAGGHNSSTNPHHRVAELELKYAKATAAYKEFWEANKKDIRKEDSDFAKGKRPDRPLLSALQGLDKEATALKKELSAAKEQIASEVAAGSSPSAPREPIHYSDKRTPGTVLVARYSDDIDADIKRGWSAYQHPNYGGTKNEVERDAEEMGIIDPVIRKLPEGGYALVHHDGLSSYEMNSESVDNAVNEASGGGLYDGSGYGQATVGNIRKMRTIPKELIGSIRDLHILEVESVEHEEMTPMTSKKSLGDNNFGLTDEETELPPLYNPNAKTNFTDEEIEALTATDDDESIALALKRATPEEKPLLKR